MDFLLRYFVVTPLLLISLWTSGAFGAFYSLAGPFIFSLPLIYIIPAGTFSAVALYFVVSFIAGLILTSIWACLVALIFVIGAHFWPRQHFANPGLRGGCEQTSFRIPLITPLLNFFCDLTIFFIRGWESLLGWQHKENTSAFRRQESFTLPEEPVDPNDNGAGVGISPHLQRQRRVDEAQARANGIGYFFREGSKAYFDRQSARGRREDSELSSEESDLPVRERGVK